MDPITMIVTALVAGASKVAGDAASDAYRTLIAALRRRFAGDAAAKTALDEHAKDPETWDAPLRKGISNNQADRDPQITHAAQAVLEAMEEGAARADVHTGPIKVKIGAHSQIQAHDIGSVVYKGPGSINE